MPYAYLPWSSGGQTLVAQFYEFLGKEAELTVAGVPANNANLRHSYTLLPLLKAGRLRYADLSLIRKISRLITEKEISTVIWEHPYFAWLAFAVRKRTGVQTIFHTHNIENERFRSVGKWWWRLLRMYEKWALKKADFVFCISEEDRLRMISHYGLSPEKAIFIPYGTPLEGIPADKAVAKEQVCRETRLSPDTTLLFFNGVLNYQPNLDALDIILEKINPLLLQSGLKYEILIAGKHLPGRYQQLSPWQQQHIRYLGFVDDIALYTKAADILLNPVQSGGGVKTKMIEALGLNTTVVSSQSGARGVPAGLCGGKLKIAADNDWEMFAGYIMEIAGQSSADTPPGFYSQYSWKEIVRKVLHVIQQ